MLSAIPLAAGNDAYVEAMYEQFLANPESVDARWRAYFAGLGGPGEDVAHGPLVAELAQRAKASRPAAAGVGAASASDGALKQGAVSRMIQIYANRGHLIANLDPLGLTTRPVPKVLGLAYLNLGEADLDTEFHTGSRNEAIKPRLKLREIIAQLKDIYCGTVGAEFAHVSDETERLWLQDRFQVGRMRQHFSAEARRNILWGLTMAEGLERYLATRYPAQKRFSLEGGDSLIPLLDDLIQTSGTHGVEDIVIGMAHRGRLNVLVNVLGKEPSVLFSEFEGNYDLRKLKGSGDVKYHKGFSCDVRTPGGNVHVALAFNPSHLEVVDPVVEGSVRARQERRGDDKGDKVMPVLIHGDAAFAGQGVVTETLQFSQVRAFYTGGTVHVVINNQVGFHHQRSARPAFDAVLQRRREDDRGADPARERRRPGVGGLRGAIRRGLPDEVPQGRRHRPRVLPASRPQRGRRARGHAAGHVRHDPRQADDAADLRREAGGRGRDRGGRGRRDGERVPPGTRRRTSRRRRTCSA